MFDEEDEAKRAHELITALRNDGYDVAYGADANEDFPEHVDVARDALEDPDAPGDGFTETYECPSCGRTGTLAVDGTTRQTRLSGCLVESGGGYL